MSRRASMLVLVLLPVVTVGLPWYRSIAAPSRPPGECDLAPDIVQNAGIARARMERIAQAVRVYMNDNLDCPPDRLSRLYPGYIGDPLVFWHPGDTDPPPTTIDNDVPNAPNSALISFEANLSVSPFWPDDAPYIKDNSPANNGGVFINVLWHKWSTEPPDMMPWPTPAVVARGNLRMLARALSAYANDNRDRWPLDAMQLVEYAGTPNYASRVFWHPGDAQPLPTEITNSVPNGLNSTQVSFDYLVAGLTANDCTPELVAFRDNTPDNNGGYGTFAAYCDGRVEYLPVCAGDATGDLRVDFDDVVMLSEHLGRYRTAQMWHGDLNADGNADMQDLAVLQMEFGRACGD